MFICSVFHDCDLIKFNIDHFTIYEPPLVFRYESPSKFNFVNGLVVIETVRLDSILYRMENTRLSPKKAYKLLQRYRKLLVFS